MCVRVYRHVICVCIYICVNGRMYVSSVIASVSVYFCGRGENFIMENCAIKSFIIFLTMTIFFFSIRDHGKKS